MNTAIAKYNMKFNNGTFIKNKEYEFNYSSNKKNIVIVKTDQKKKQEFTAEEFEVLFLFDK